MSDHTIDPRKAGERPSVTQLLRQLIQIGIALTSERELAPLLERIVSEARRFTNAEAGTLYLRDGDALHFAAAQNDVLVERLGAREMRHQFAAEPLPLTTPSLAGYVALTGQAICLPDAYGVPTNRPARSNTGRFARGLGNPASHHADLMCVSIGDHEFSSSRGRRSRTRCTPWRSQSAEST